MGLREVWTGIPLTAPPASSGFVPVSDGASYAWSSYDDLDISPDAVVIATSDSPAAFRKRATFVADGTADEEEWFDALDAASIPDGSPVTVRSAKRPIVLAPGMFTVTEPLTVKSAQWVNISGCGNMTQLRPLGTMDQVLLLNAVNYSRIGGFRVRGFGTDHDVTDAVALEKTAGTFGSIHSTTLHDIFIEGNVRFVNGVSISRQAHSDVAQVTLRNIAVTGQGKADTTRWQYGIRWGDGTAGNVLNQWAYNLQLGSVKVGLLNDSVNVSVFGAGFDSCGTDVYLGSIGRPFSMEGFRSESADRFLTTAGPTTAPMFGAFRDGIISMDDAAADGRVIDMNNGGNFVFENVSIGSVKSGVSPRIYPDSGNIPVTVSLRGVSAPVSFATLFSDLANHSLLTVDAAPYFEVNSSSVIQQAVNGLSTRSITAAHTVKATDGVIRADATSAAFTVTLPPVTWQNGRVVTIVKTDASANAVTVDADGAEIINGPDSLDAQNSTITLRCNGTSWDVIGTSGTVS